MSTQSIPSSLNTPISVLKQRIQDGDCELRVLKGEFLSDNRCTIGHVNKLIASHGNGEIIIWENEQIAKRFNIGCHVPLRGMRMAAFQDRLFIAPDKTPAPSNTIVVLDLKTGKEIKSFQVLANQIHCLCTLNDRLYLGCNEDTIMVRDVNTLEPYPSLKSKDGMKAATCLYGVENTLCSGHESGKIQEWNLASAVDPKVYQLHNVAVSRIIKSENKLVSAAINGEIVVIDSQKPELSYTLPPGKKPMFDSVLSIATFSGLLLSSNAQDTVKVRDLNTGKDIIDYTLSKPSQQLKLPVVSMIMKSNGVLYATYQDDIHVCDFNMPSRLPKEKN
jgi:WD40 repeat protein